MRLAPPGQDDPLVSDWIQGKLSLSPPGQGYKEERSSEYAEVTDADYTDA